MIEFAVSAEIIQPAVMIWPHLRIAASATAAESFKTRFMSCEIAGADREPIYLILWAGSGLYIELPSTTPPSRALTMA